METTFSMLFDSLRNYDDFGTAIEATPSLRSKIRGVGVYRTEGDILYMWGQAPGFFVAPAFDQESAVNDWPRLYLENPSNNSVTLLLKLSRKEPRPPPPPDDKREAQERKAHPFMFKTLREADVIFLEILQTDYWKKERLQAALFPSVEIVLAALILAAQMLVLKNAEYRKRIEEQKNLVVLGTAASTLAHEIKNPLLAIRLQTSILAKTLHGEGSRELEIIDSEVQRLSSLSNRIGDYLRDPAGNPAVIDPADIAQEVGERLCGRSILSLPQQAAFVRIDPERLRSVIENLLRNALESGGDEAEVRMEISSAESFVWIDILDRGTGIPSASRERLFDPFFTTKSRGSGIGLSVCRRFTQAAKGSISLENRTGGGTRARLALPRTGPEARGFN